VEAHAGDDLGAVEERQREHRLVSHEQLRSDRVTLRELAQPLILTVFGKPRQPPRAEPVEGRPVLKDERERRGQAALGFRQDLDETLDAADGLVVAARRRERAARGNRPVAYDA
jgi:hypothetical protein